MKKFIPLVLGVWMMAVVGCTTTETTTTTTRERQSNAQMDPMVDANRTERMPERGPR